MKRFLIFLSFTIVFQITAQKLITQVKTKKGWSYMDNTGKQILDTAFNDCFPFSENGYATIYSSKLRGYTFLNLGGDIIYPELSKFKLMGVFSLGSGKIAGETFHNNLLPISVDYKWGYLNVAGKIAIPLKYDKITAFNGGYATAELDGTFFIIDTLGKEVKIKNAEITKVKQFSEGLAPFMDKSGKYGFIDTKGNIKIRADYYSVGYFSNGFAWVRVRNGDLGYINNEGEWAVEAQFSVSKNFDEQSGLARVSAKKGGWCYTNSKGELIFIERCVVWGDYSEGLCKGKRGSKWGYFNKEGEWVIPATFGGLRDFHNGLAAARKKGKWGFIDKEGNWVLEPIYDGVKDFVLVKEIGQK